MARKYTGDLVKEIVEVDTNHEYSLLSIENHGKKNPITGKTMKRKMSLKHNECGHTYEIDIYEFIEGKRRCGKCKGKVLRAQNAEDIEVIKLKTKKLTGGEYSFVDDHYINSKTDHKFLHHTCGTVFKKKWEKFKGTPKQSGQRCTECYRKGMESGASRFVRDVLDHLHITYDCEKRFKDCTNPDTGNVLPFDYYLPEVNTLIEVDGEQHERGSFTKYDSKGTRKRDKIKNRYAEEKGIELVRIPAKKWSQLPEFLHAIIARDLRPNLTLKEVKSIAQSSHPERINKDLKKVHNAEYKLHDPYYFGVDRVHWFKHNTCEHIFQSTLYTIKSSKFPCPECRQQELLKSGHSRSSDKLSKKSKGRYSLDPAHIGIDEKGRRLTQCHQCNTSWWVTVGNLMKNKAGCPNCLEEKKENEWLEKLTAYKAAIQKGKKLSTAQKQWLVHNKRRYLKNKLQGNRLLLLKKDHLL